MNSVSSSTGTLTHSAGSGMPSLAAFTASAGKIILHSERRHRRADQLGHDVQPRLRRRDAAGR